MRNIDKYEKEIKKYSEEGKCIAITKQGKVKDCQQMMKCNDCIFENNCSMSAYLKWLLAEYEEPLLDNVEKQYLENLLRSFKDRVISICKWCANECSGEEHIKITVHDHIGESINNIRLPYFKLGAMYKGMERNKYYTLEELGLFENE